MPPHHKCFTASALPPALLTPPGPSQSHPNQSTTTQPSRSPSPSYPLPVVPDYDQLPTGSSRGAISGGVGLSGADLFGAGSARTSAQQQHSQQQPQQEAQSTSREAATRPQEALIAPTSRSQTPTIDSHTQQQTRHSLTAHLSSSPERVLPPRIKMKPARPIPSSDPSLDRNKVEHAPPPPPATLPLSSILPELVELLSCATCHHILRNPTTLGCGHAVCIGCADQPRAFTGPPLARGGKPHDHTRTNSLPAKGSELQPPPTRSASGGILSGWLHFGHHSPAPPALSPERALAAREGASSPATLLPTPASTPLTSPALASASGTSGGWKLKPALKKNHCGRAGCKTWDKPRKGLKVDYVTQRALSLLLNAFPALDELDDGAPVQQEEEEDAVAESISSVGMTALFSQESAALSVSSFDSGGGGEDPNPDKDDSKRLHRARSFQPEKRSRRGSRERSEEDGTSAESAEPQAKIAALPPLRKGFDRAEWHGALECAVCFQLLAEPVTTPCAHTFCSGCLLRAHDHTASCPLCRAHLPLGGGSPNKTLGGVIELVFEDEVRERERAMEEEARVEGYPIFICTLSWPALPTFIHIFEPRYRLMLRRVLDSPSRSFGMVLPARDGSPSGAHPYGTMLRVETCRTLEDGRSIVETMGTWRFRLLDRKQVDGYAVGRVERIEDVSSEVERDLERTAVERGRMPAFERDRSTADLMRICTDFVASLRKESAPWVVQRLNNTIGPMPSDPGHFTFWMAEVMPVDDHTKAALLQVTSPRERLRLIVFWIEQFRASWWFTKGCDIM